MKRMKRMSVTIEVELDTKLGSERVEKLLTAGLPSFIEMELLPVTRTRVRGIVVRVEGETDIEAPEL